MSSLMRDAGVVQLHRSFNFGIALNAHACFLAILWNTRVVHVARIVSFILEHGSYRGSLCLIDVLGQLVDEPEVEWRAYQVEEEEACEHHHAHYTLTVEHTVTVAPVCELMVAWAVGFSLGRECRAIPVFSALHHRSSIIRNREVRQIGLSRISHENWVVRLNFTWEVSLWHRVTYVRFGVLHWHPDYSKDCRHGEYDSESDDPGSQKKFPRREVSSRACDNEEWYKEPSLEKHVPVLACPANLCVRVARVSLLECTKQTNECQHTEYFDSCFEPATAAVVHFQ